MKALKELKKNNDVVILPADKGNTTVVMDRAECDEKMKKLVETQEAKQGPHQDTEGQSFEDSEKAEDRESSNRDRI